MIHTRNWAILKLLNRCSCGSCCVGLAGTRESVRIGLGEYTSALIKRLWYSQHLRSAAQRQHLPTEGLEVGVEPEALVPSQALPLVLLNEHKTFPTQPEPDC